MAIHFTHRLGAILTLAVLVSTALWARRRWPLPAVRTATTLVIGAVVLQVTLGIAIVWFGLPLPVATAHNGVAALLLLAMINLLNATSTGTSSRLATGR